MAGDPQSVIIRFFDPDGLDLTEDTQRKIERLFNREDFRRVFPGEIGDIGFAPRALEHYATALEGTVDIERIRAAQFKVVIDYAYGSTSLAMPNVLAKLGLDVLAVNPFISTAGVMGDDLHGNAERVADLVRSSGSHLGAVIDPDGERLLLIDDAGHLLTDTEALLALLTLLPPKLNGDRVALPVSTTRHVEDLLAPSGVSVLWTKLSGPALMAAAGEPGVGFAGKPTRSIHPAGVPAGLRRVGDLREGARSAGVPRDALVEVVGSLPRVHVVHETVVTPWDQKGAVMRSLMEQSKDREVELIDGVKVMHEDGWALALPDPEEPYTHIWAEGASDADARRLAQEYARRIRQMVR